jgi:hypothetical protein
MPNALTQKLSPSMVSCLQEKSNPTGAARGVHGARWTAATLTALMGRGFLTRTETPEGYGRYAITAEGQAALDQATGGGWEAETELPADMVSPPAPTAFTRRFAR